MVEPAVEGQGELVGRIAQKRQPAVVAGDHVELVAMNHQQAPAIGGQVLGLVDQLDVAQHQFGIAAQELVMVAGDVDDFGAALAHGQQTADHVGVRLGPVHAATQFPAIDDVADQVDAVRLVALEELRQVLGLAIPGTQVHVRYPQGAYALFARGSGKLGTGHRQAPGRFAPACQPAVNRP
ncbi:hypothetical protein D3C80_1206590 [compost metagenome]